MSITKPNQTHLSYEEAKIKPNFAVHAIKLIAFFILIMSSNLTFASPLPEFIQTQFDRFPEFAIEHTRPKLYQLANILSFNPSRMKIYLNASIVRSRECILKNTSQDLTKSCIDSELDPSIEFAKRERVAYKKELTGYSKGLQNLHQCFYDLWTAQRQLKTMQDENDGDGVQYQIDFFEEPERKAVLPRSIVTVGRYQGAMFNEYYLDYEKGLFPGESYERNPDLIMQFNTTQPSLDEQIAYRLIEYFSEVTSTLSEKQPEITSWNTSAKERFHAIQFIIFDNCNVFENKPLRDFFELHSTQYLPLFQKEFTEFSVSLPLPYEYKDSI